MDIREMKDTSAVWLMKVAYIMEKSEFPFYYIEYEVKSQLLYIGTRLVHYISSNKTKSTIH